MAYAKTKFGEKEVELRTSAATDIIFKQVFKFDLMKTLTKLRDIEEREEDEQLDASVDADELFKKLAYIMEAQGRRVDYGKLSTSDYIQWLDGFDEIPVTAVMQLYTNGEITTEEEKNQSAVQSES